MGKFNANAQLERHQVQACRRLEKDLDLLRQELIQEQVTNEGLRSVEGGLQDSRNSLIAENYSLLKEYTSLKETKHKEVAALDLLRQERV
jgi:hypothetical protein